MTQENHCGLNPMPLISQECVKNYPETVAEIRTCSWLSRWLQDHYGMEGFFYRPVHWAMCHENIQDDEQLIEHIHKWNNHKRS